jgi:Transposase and inactivated derivatives
MDEIFPIGTTQCVLVLKDEHGRIVASQALDQRDEAHVTPFLEWLHTQGVQIKTFYIDHCPAYVNAIETVYQDAKIQFDYFHIIQNIWRPIWKEFCGFRRQVKERSEASQTPWYSAKLKRLAHTLWTNRYLLFKSDKHLTAEEKEKLLEIMNAHIELSFMRKFLEKVWSIFEASTTEPQAHKKLKALKDYTGQPAKESGFAKSIKFLEDHFDRMITFLKVPGVQRNSLAESGMRVLRRLEESHDGFRSEEGRKRADTLEPKWHRFLGRHVSAMPALTPHEPGGLYRPTSKGYVIQNLDIVQVKFLSLLVKG